MKEANKIVAKGIDQASGGLQQAKQVKPTEINKGNLNA
jgi:hypothetical protein